YLMFLFPQLGNLTALRSLRVLRALKTVTAVPGLKTIVGALLDAVRNLTDILVLTIFVLSIFALVGLQLYKGTLLKKCVREFPVNIHGLADLSDLGFSHLNLTRLFSYDNSSLPITFNLGGPNSDRRGSESALWEKFDNSTRERVVKQFYDNPNNWYRNDSVCREADSNSSCPIGYTCVRTQIGNPNNGWTSFDDFGSALLCTFRLMTQDYWEHLYRLVIVANGEAHILYFILVIFLGSYYLVNVILAIVSLSYDAVCAQDAADAEEELEAKRAEEERREAGKAIENETGTAHESGSNPNRPFPSEEAPEQVSKLSRTPSIKKPCDSPSVVTVSVNSGNCESLLHRRGTLTRQPSIVHQAIMQDYKKSLTRRRQAIQVDKRFLFDFMNELPSDQKTLMRNQGFHAAVQAAKEAGYENRRLRQQYEESRLPKCPAEAQLMTTSFWMDNNRLKKNTRRRVSNFEIVIPYERPASVIPFSRDQVSAIYRPPRFFVLALQM
ncbi:hypothetical protein Ciccas_008386, partial [Cichlidogyrus casuarinus]